MVLISYIYCRFIAVETVRGSSDTLFVMITNQQVFFLRNLDPELHKENIILNVKHKDYSLCRNIELGKVSASYLSQKNSKLC